MGLYIFLYYKIIKNIIKGNQNGNGSAEMPT